MCNSSTIIIYYFSALVVWHMKCIGNVADVYVAQFSVDILCVLSKGLDDVVAWLDAKCVHCVNNKGPIATKIAMCECYIRAKVSDAAQATVATIKIQIYNRQNIIIL